MQPPRYFARLTQFCFKTFRIGLWIVIFSSSIGCSLYRSEDRQEFESRAPQALGLQSVKPLPQYTICDDITQITYWYETRFPSPHTQWIESLPNLEVWLDRLPNTSVRIMTYETQTDSQTSPRPITRCVAVFQNFEEWKSYRSFYLKSLEGEQP